MPADDARRDAPARRPPAVHRDKFTGDDWVVPAGTPLPTSQEIRDEIRRDRDHRAPIQPPQPSDPPA